MSQHRRPSDNFTRPITLKFPDFTHEEVLSPTSEQSSSPRLTNFALPEQSRWQPAATATRRADRVGYNSGWPPNTGRGRQKSLSDAFRSIKERKGSVSENAADIAEALKAPVSPKLVALCCLWYTMSIFSSASSKAILTAFRYPITLTVVQFAFVCSLCIISSTLAHIFPRLATAIPALKYSIRHPTKQLILTTLPLTAFQIGGHILNSDAMARIPVSLVHTIKGLSPLLTVMAYRVFFRVHYSLATYLSLIPLTGGVIMACSTDFRANTPGLLYAFGSALLFVTQNIVSKRLFNEAARAEVEGPGLVLKQKEAKPDKLNLLCYSSGLAFLLTMPLWLWSEGYTLIGEFASTGTLALRAQDRPGALHDHRRVVIEFFFNGFTHFAQSLVAFILLSMVSPVTYSVASLIKRVFVVTCAIVWFGNQVTRTQASGIGITFLGLYLYDRTNDAARGERRARAAMSGKSDGALLPLVSGDKKFDPLPTSNGNGLGNGVSYAYGPGPGIPLQQRNTPSPVRGFPARVIDEKRRSSLSTGSRGRSGSNADGHQRRGSNVVISQGYT